MKKITGGRGIVTIYLPGVKALYDIFTPGVKICGNEIIVSCQTIFTPPPPPPPPNILSPWVKISLQYSHTGVKIS